MSLKVTKRSRKRRPAFKAKQRHFGVAQGSKSLGRIAGMNLATGFAKGNVTDIMELIFNCPVATPNGLYLVKGDHFTTETGDGVTHMGGLLTRFQEGTLAGAA